MQTNTEIMQACFAAFQRGDIPAILNLFDENVEINESGDRKSIPFAGQWKGQSGSAEFFRIIGETTETLKFAPQQVLASGEHAVGLVAYEFRVKATGKVARADFALDFTIRNGKVTRTQAYYDTAAIAAAFAGTAKASA